MTTPPTSWKELVIRHFIPPLCHLLLLLLAKEAWGGLSTGNPTWTATATDPPEGVVRPHALQRTEGHQAPCSIMQHCVFWLYRVTAEHGFVHSAAPVFRQSLAITFYCIVSVLRNLHRPSYLLSLQPVCNEKVWLHGSPWGCPHTSQAYQHIHCLTFDANAERHFRLLPAHSKRNTGGVGICYAYIYTDVYI